MSSVSSAGSARRASSGSCLLLNHRDAVIRDLAYLRVARGEPHERELAYRGSQRVPTRSTALELDEEPAPRESAKCLVRLFDAERGAEIGGEAVERGDPRDEVRDPTMLAGEDLGGEVCEQRPAGAPHALECGRDIGGGHATQGLRGETDGRGPAPGEALQVGRHGRVCAAGEVGDQRRGFVHVEGELRAGDLHDLPLSSEALHGEGKLVAGRDDEVKALRSLPTKCLDVPDHARRRCDLVDIVQHQHEVAVKLGLQGLADQRGKTAASDRVVLSRARTCAGPDGARRVHGKCRYAQPERVG